MHPVRAGAARGGRLILQGIWSALLVFSGTYSDLLDYVIFAALLFYVLTVAGLFILRYRRPDRNRPIASLAIPYCRSFISCYVQPS